MSYDSWKTTDPRDREPLDPGDRDYNPCPCDECQEDCDECDEPCACAEMLHWEEVEREICARLKRSTP